MSLLVLVWLSWKWLVQNNCSSHGGDIAYSVRLEDCEWGAKRGALIWTCSLIAFSWTMLVHRWRATHQWWLPFTTSFLRYITLSRWRDCPSWLLQIDGSVLVAMQPRLCEQLRSSAGASTRTACAQLLTLLSLRAPQLLGQHQAQCGEIAASIFWVFAVIVFAADKLFNALISGTRDRNPSVRKHFASAASYMAKYASHASFETLMRTVLKDLLADNGEFL